MVAKSPRLKSLSIAHVANCFQFLRDSLSNSFREKILSRSHIALNLSEKSLRVNLAQSYQVAILVPKQ